MLEEYVRSLSRIQEKEPHKNQPTAMRGQSFRLKVPPLLRRDQVLNIHLNKWLLNVNFSYKDYLNNNLTFQLSKFILRFTFIFDRLNIQNPPRHHRERPSTKQQATKPPTAYKETLSANPGRVLNNHLTISRLLFRLCLSIHGYLCGHMCGGGIFKTLLINNSQRSKYR